MWKIPEVVVAVVVVVDVVTEKYCTMIDENYFDKI